MSINCGSFGINSRLGIAGSGAIVGGTINAAGSVLPLLRQNMVFQSDRAVARGMTGSVNPTKNGSREAPKMVTGGVLFEAGAAELSAVAGAIVAGGGSTHDGSALDVHIDADGVSKGYRHCIVRQANIRMRTDSNNPENQFMQIALQFLGIDEGSGSIPAGVNQSANPIWMANDATATFGGGSFPCLAFDFMVRYELMPLYRNSLTPVCFRCLRREVQLEVQVPLAGASVSAAGAAATMGSVSVAMSSSLLPPDQAGSSNTLTISNAQAIGRSQPVSGPQEVPLSVTFRSFEDGASVLSIT